MIKSKGLLTTMKFGDLCMISMLGFVERPQLTAEINVSALLGFILNICNLTEICGKYHETFDVIFAQLIYLYPGRMLAYILFIRRLVAMSTMKLLMFGSFSVRFPAHINAMVILGSIFIK